LVNRHSLSLPAGTWPAVNPTVVEIIRPTVDTRYDAINEDRRGIDQRAALPAGRLTTVAITTKKRVLSIATLRTVAGLVAVRPAAVPRGHGRQNSM
jgi:hypothetical protein